MSGTLQGQRVLVTRPGEVGRELAITLAAAGAEGRWAPAIDFDAAGEEELRAARASATQAEAILVSSPRVLDLLWPENETLPEVPFLVVGTATAERARARGAEVMAVSEEGLDPLVADLVGQGDWSGRRVFWACGNLSEPARLEPLRAVGAETICRVIYRTIDVYARDGFAEELLGGLHAVVVASPSAVEALAGAFARADRSELFSVLRFIANGATTAAALDRRGAARVSVAATPGNAGLVAALRSS